jgi:hypothetical protein
LCGGLAQHGYPLSFEVNPEIREANNVLLGQFGRRILAEMRR